MTPREARIGGAVIIVPSFVVTAIGAGLLFLVLEMPIPAAWLPAGVRVDGPPRTGPHWSHLWSGLGAVLAAILLFAAIGFVQGLWMAILGRRNLSLLRAMLRLVAGLLMVGAVATLVLGRRIGQVGQ